MSLAGVLLVAVYSACQKSRSNPYSYPRVEVRCGPVPWRAEACKKTYTSNGGLLGSWVDEERSKMRVGM